MRDSRSLARLEKKNYDATESNSLVSAGNIQEFGYYIISLVTVVDGGFSYALFI